MKIRTVAQLGLLCLATVLMVCADAQAQPGGGRGGRGFGGGGGFGRGGFGGALALIQRDDVQTELSLTDAQKDQIETIADELREAGGGRGGRGDFADLSQEEIQKAIADRLAESQKQQDAALAKAKDVLNANQSKRYGELEIQFAVQQIKTSNQLKVLAAYLDDAKIQAAMGEPFEFQQQQFGFGGGRGGRGGRDGAGGGRRGGRGGDAGADAGGDDAPSGRRDRGADE